VVEGSFVRFRNIKHACMHAWIDGVVKRLTIFIMFIIITWDVSIFV
jgi:hypothetical protein